MLYKRLSGRQLWRVDRRRLIAACGRDRAASAPEIRGLYDTNEAGDAAPHTDFVSRREARRLLRRFDRVHVEAENLEALYVRGRRLASRERLLGSQLARAFGLDLYITATK